MYSIKFSSLAENDLDETCAYLVNVLKNPQAAKDLLTELEEKLDSLKKLPFSCPLVSDIYLQNMGIRFLIVKNHIAFLKMSKEDNEIVMVRFLYNRRQWQDILI